MAEMVCKKCMRIIESSERECKACGSTDLTTEWSGMVIILNPKKSQIAKKMNLDIIPSIYALRVR